jgi:asparagine synthase (glutamine-hydrolysing)
MCGIAGIYPFQAKNDVRIMVDQLRHRGPDGHGVIGFSNGTLGHTRLAILDVAGGHQPMVNQTASISFNGEIYNYQELQSQYLSGERLQTRTDTEVVLHLYKRLGPQCAELLDGMFALAIVDGEELFLARDPLGIKPLYYGRQNGHIAFASEIKALSKITSDILEFPAGHWYHTRHGWQRYYHVRKSLHPDAIPTDRKQVAQAIYNTLRLAVHKRLMSDVPLGVSLSGGLDSSIVSLLAKEGLPDLNSFAVGVPDSPDLEAARSVAAFLGTHHHELVYTTEDILAALPEVLFYLETFDPALVRSAVPNYFLAQLAAEHVKVFLTGEGADELFAGYSYLAALQEPDELQSELTHITDALHNTNLQRADRMSMAFSLEARVPFLDVEAVALALSLPALWKLHRRDRPEKALLRRAFAGKLPDEIIHRPKAKFSKGAGSSEMVAHMANEQISDRDFRNERKRLKRDWNYRLPNKEALYYYNILREHYKDEWILPEMGQSRSL